MCMRNFILSLLILVSFTLNSAGAMQINYMAGYPASVTHYGVTRPIMGSTRVARPSYRTTRYNYNYNAPRRYTAPTPCRRSIVSTGVVRSVYGTSRPVIVNNNVVVEPSRENKIYEPVKNTQPRTYTRDGITYYN